MKKKLLSLFMACAMILALAVPAFAATYNSNPDDSASDELQQTVTIATRTFIPTVALTLPTMTEPSVVLNPYKITFAGEDAVVNGQEVKDTSAAAADQNPDQEKQVISPVYFIKNQTNVKLNYTVAVTGSLEGDVTFSQEPVGLSETKKKAHIALMVANKGIVPASGSTDPSQATTAEQKITNVNGLTAADIETQWLKTTEVKFAMPKSLDAVTSGANYVAFQFKGDLTRQPTPNSWKAEDKIGAVITFTFTPESAQDYTVASTSALPLGTFDIKDGETAPAVVQLNTMSGYSNMDVNATNPNWGIVNAGAYDAAKLDKSSTSVTFNDSLTLDIAKVKANVKGANGAALGTSATSCTDTVILSFNDSEGIPRTVQLPISFDAKDTTT